MSIGKWIVVVFILFAVFIGTLVAVCVRQDISLVSKDYYKDELAYEDQIKRVNNTTLSNIYPDLKFGNDTLSIEFPEAVEIQNGRVEVFCPSNAKLDQKFELKPNADTQSFRINTITGKMFRVKIWWSSEDKDYYIEKQIFF